MEFSMETDINMSTHYELNIVCKSKISNMRVVQNFQAISNKFN
jgi:hypothetical protein